jgi:hypothetical protein
MGTPIIVRRGIMMKPPPTPSNPEKKPVAPPTTRLSVIVSRVMNVLTPGCVDSRSNLHTALDVFARIMC